MTSVVSAIVLFHDERSAREALECIEALKTQDIEKPIEIIVVDNHAEDRARRLMQDAVSDDTSVTYVRTKTNLGYGRGNNAGAKHATGEFLLIINPDNRLERDALRIMVEHLREHPNVGLVGPQLIFPNGTVRDSYRTFPTPSDLLIKRTPLKRIFRKRMRSYLQWDEDQNQTRHVDWLCGACLLLRRSIFEELGGFDERFFLFLEDCDLCRRVWEKELKVVYLPAAKAHDQQQRLSAGGPLSLFTKKTVRIHTASAAKYFRKWRGKSVPRADDRTPAHSAQR